ncbi:MAG: hypothetical protein ACKO2T_21510, partial [Microcystis aeruginosa]
LSEKTIGKIQAVLEEELTNLQEKLKELQKSELGKTIDREDNYLSKNNASTQVLYLNKRILSEFFFKMRIAGYSQNLFPSLARGSLFKSRRIGNNLDVNLSHLLMFLILPSFPSLLLVMKAILLKYA